MSLSRAQPFHYLSSNGRMGGCRDNPVRFHNLVMQLERAHWRHTLAGSKAIIHQHLDMTLTLMIAGHRIGQFTARKESS